jgi:hypothetical protein
MPLGLTDVEAFRWGFRRSKRDSLWRTFDGRLCVVFEYRRRRGYGYLFKWAGDGGAQPVFSREAHPSEDDALEAMYYHLTTG